MWDRFSCHRVRTTVSPSGERLIRTPWPNGPLPSTIFGSPPVERTRYPESSGSPRKVIHSPSKDQPTVMFPLSHAPTSGVRRVGSPAMSGRTLPANGTVQIPPSATNAKRVPSGDSMAPLRRGGLPGIWMRRNVGDATPACPVAGRPVAERASHDLLGLVGIVVDEPLVDLARLPSAELLVAAAEAEKRPGHEGAVVAVALDDLLVQGDGGIEVAVDGLELDGPLEPNRRVLSGAPGDGEAGQHETRGHTGQCERHGGALVSSHPPSSPKVGIPGETGTRRR